MNNIKLLNRLNEEQEEIINSTDEKIVVSAGPGSGKTYTIVKRVLKELEYCEDYEGVIVCSFTNASANQLRKKIIAEDTIKSSYIGTIDSLVFNEIIDAFKNRYIDFLGEKINIKKLRPRLPKNYSDINRLTKMGLKENNPLIRNYVNLWFNKFLKSIYEISFPTYIIASKMISDFSVVSDYLSCRYRTIYIDEAQDLNEFQHYFLQCLIEKCGIKAILFGDKNQSIYEFRGARPEQFYFLKDKGYKEYKITVSVRCHPSILYFSNLIIDPKYESIPEKEIRVKLDYPPLDDQLSGLIGNFMILFETNDIAMHCYNYYKDKTIDVIYSKRLELNNKEFEDDYLNLIEECLRFIININNPVPRLIYSIEDFKDYLDNLFDITSKVNAAINNIDMCPSDYITYLFKTLDIDLPLDFYDDLRNKLENEVYCNHYKNFENVNRITTIHSSKGLEADNVFVRLEFSQNYLNDEYRRKLFVAFSRAKENLYISYKNKEIEGSALDRELKQNIKKISIE